MSPRRYGKRRRDVGEVAERHVPQENPVKGPVSPGVLVGRPSVRGPPARLGAAELARLLTEAEQVTIATPTGVDSLAGPVVAEFARVAQALSAMLTTATTRPSSHRHAS